MRIALVGYGQMGHMIEAAAERHGLDVIAKYWDQRPFSDNSEIREEIRDVDVLIDFSTPDTAFNKIRAGLSMGKNMIVGTTGWHDKLMEVKTMVQQANAGLVHASNFSLGVNLFYRIVDRAAALMARFDQYDPFIEESHHRLKVDAPSGTALELKRILKHSYTETDIPVTSVRAGHIPGTHAVSMDSAVDTIRMEHCARSREGFAEGAVMAAKWIMGEKGIFAFSDVLDLILDES